MRKWICMVMLITTTGVTSAAEEMSVTITLQESAQVEGKQIALEQVATVSGPEEQIAKLATVSLGPAPLPGYQRPLSLGCVKLRLRRAGWEPDEFSFAGAAVTLVSRNISPRIGSGQGSPSDGKSRSQPTALQPNSQGNRGEVQPEIWVRRGDRVRILLKYKAITISSAGQALENAAANDMVKVRVSGSRNTVYGLVVSPKVVAIQLY